MQKIKAIIQAFTGYAGSSESPEAVSTRFMGIAIGLVSQFAPIIVALFHPSVDITQFVNAAQPIVLLVAIVMWLYGAIKACWLAAKASPVVGRFLVK